MTHEEAVALCWAVWVHVPCKDHEKLLCAVVDSCRAAATNMPERCVAWLRELADALEAKEAESYDATARPIEEVLRELASKVPKEEWDRFDRPEPKWDALVAEIVKICKADALAWGSVVSMLGIGLRMRANSEVTLPGNDYNPAIKALSDAVMAKLKGGMKPISDEDVTLLRLALDKSIGHWGELAYMLPELIARIESDGELIAALAPVAEQGLSTCGCLDEDCPTCGALERLLAERGVTLEELVKGGGE